MAPQTPPNLLEASGLPIAYAISPESTDVPTPADLDGFATSARTVIRSLTVMQKEAIVATSASPIAWRLSSDEGPYLNGHDFAPAPLAVMTAGFAADLMVQVRRSLAANDLAAGDLSADRLILDTHFTMSGSMLQGTMQAGARPPEIAISAPGRPRQAVAHAAHTAINAAATTGLMHESLHGLFSLTVHGRRIPTGKVTALDGDAPTDPGGYRSSPVPDQTRMGEPLVSKLVDVGDKTPDAGASLQESQERSLHLQASCHWREDGVKVIDVDVIRPFGSTFRLLSDEPPGPGGEGRAPDALALMSAGLGFCFMTQIGRFAKIAKQGLGDYSIIQDTRFSLGDAKGEAPVGGRAAPPSTHVYLAPEGDDDFARKALDMSEQTCFLHALCRAALRPKVRVSVS